MPLPSIAVSDKRFQNKKGNDWSGPPEGLTAQRAIRALENYGHHAESVLIGLALTAALLPRDMSNGPAPPAAGPLGPLVPHVDTSSAAAAAVPVGNFPQQIDPFTAVPEPGDGYGPMIMSFLEYTALRLGVVPRPERNALLWSGLLTPGTADSTAGSTYTYTQRLGDVNFTLAIGEGEVFSGSRNGVQLFEAWGGLRVLTDLDGTVTEIWGISDVTRDVGVKLLTGSSALLNLTLAPNEEWQVDMLQRPPSAKLIRSPPFYPPY